MLLLGDFKDDPSTVIYEWICKEFKMIPSTLDTYRIEIAYTEIDGYDEDCFFLLQDREILEWFEVNGWHCSCMGFEGQFDPELTSIDALLLRKKWTGNSLSDDKTQNDVTVLQHLNGLKMAEEIEKTMRELQ